MSDGVMDGERRSLTHACSALSELEAPNGVICFECYRASGRRDAVTDEAGQGPASSAHPQESRRTLTPREIQHRERMLEWLRRA